MTNKFIYTSMIVNNHLKKSKTMEKMKSRKIVFLFFFFLTYLLLIQNELAKPAILYLVLQLKFLHRCNNSISKFQNRSKFLQKNAYTNPPSLLSYTFPSSSPLSPRISQPQPNFSTFNLPVARLDPLLTEAEQSLAIFVRSHDDIFGAGRLASGTLAFFFLFFFFFGPLTTTQRG